MVVAHDIVLGRFRHFYSWSFAIYSSHIVAKQERPKRRGTRDNKCQYLPRPDI